MGGWAAGACTIDMLSRLDASTGWTKWRAGLHGVMHRAVAVLADQRARAQEEHRIAEQGTQERMWGAHSPKHRARPLHR